MLVQQVAWICRPPPARIVPTTGFSFPEKVVFGKTGIDQNSVQELTNQLTKKPYISSQQQSISDSIEGGKIGQNEIRGIIISPLIQDC